LRTRFGFRLPRNRMVLLMSSWKPKRREPEKTKAELREMLAKAVRNTTQPKTNIRPSPKTKKGRR
jgi:hypothetical protein